MKIKSVKKYTSAFRNMAFGGDPDAEVLASETFYDESGNVIHDHKMDDSEGKNEKTIFKYNDKGVLIEQEHFMLDDDISERFVFERDEKSRLLSYIKFYSDDEGEKVLYSYLDHEHPVTIERYDADGEIESTEKLEYNDKHLMVNHQLFDEEGNLTEKTEIEYNDKSLPILEKTFDQNGALLQSKEIVYNSNNDITGITERNGAGKIISDINISYDEKGNVLERAIKDYHSRKVCFEYDENDNCITESVYDDHGNLSMKATFEYDENNQLKSETGYFLDGSRSGMNGNSTSRYEYVYW